MYVRSTIPIFFKKGRNKMSLINEPEMLEELLNPDSTKEEKNYIINAIERKVQTTEILNVIVLTRLTRYNLRNLVGAMEKEEFIVYPVLPNEIQKLYTNVKDMIIRIWKLHQLDNGRPE